MAVTVTHTRVSAQSDDPSRPELIQPSDWNASHVVTGAVDSGGDTMTGALVLPGDPTSELEAVTKQYVDNIAASILDQVPPPGLDEGDVQTLINTAILNLQGTPTGLVTEVSVASGNATISGASWATTDTYNITGATANGRTVTLPSGVSGTRTIVSARTNTRSVRIIKGTTTYTLGAGGFIIIYLDGSANYMRVIAAGGASADFLLRSGDTMSGALILSGDPTVALGAATKQYVDSTAGAAWQITWTAIDNHPPASNFATLDTRNSHSVLDFDTTTQEAAIFAGVLPFSYQGSGVTVYVYAALTSATSGTLGWDVAFERMDASSLDIDADSFATAQTITAATVPGTSGQILRLSVNVSNGANMDNLAAGDAFRLRVRRDVTNDTATGDAELLRVVMVEQ